MKIALDTASTAMPAGVRTKGTSSDGCGIACMQ